MATIRKLSNGSKPWQAIVRRQGYQSKSKTFITKRDAIRWAHKRELEIDQGLYTDFKLSETLSFRFILERYQQEVVPHKRGQRQFLSQIRIMARSKAFKGLSVARVNPASIVRHRDYRLQSGISASTVRKDLTFLHRLFEVIIKEWHIPLPQGNPVTQVSRPKDLLTTARTRRLEGDELAKLLSALRHNKLMQNIILLAIETAMRRSEIANIQQTDVNLEARTLHIPVTKTNTPRTIPLSSKAIEILGDIRQFNIKPDSITQAFHRACKRTGIENLHFHDLRHEATSRFFEKGLTPIQVSTITGHKDFQMLNRYTHLRAEDLVSLL